MTFKPRETTIAVGTAEVEALAAVVKALDPIRGDTDAIRRIVRYVQDRYGLGRPAVRGD